MNNNNNNKNVHHSGSEYSLFVGDLPHGCTNESLQRLFQSKFKSVKRVQIIKNEDGSSRGFGFIRFEDQTDFQSALSQEIELGGTTLRLDTAHRCKLNSRGRYNSFNSTVSNSSNHHNHHHFNNSNLHHHHNQPHHHHHPHAHHHPSSQHRHQHGNQQNQPGGGATNKTLLSNHTPGNQHQSQQQGHNQVGGRSSTNSNNNNTNNNDSNPSQSSLTGSGQHQGPHHRHHQTQQPSSQQHHTSNLGHSLYNSNTQKNNNSPHQSVSDSKQDSKQANLGLSGDDSIKAPNQSQLASQTSSLGPTQAHQQPLATVPQTQHSLAQVPSNSIVSQVAGSNIAASTTTTATATTMPITSSNHTAAAVAVAMHNSQQNLSTTHQQAMAHDLRGYVQPTMMDTQLMGAAEPPSVVPPTSVYGHMYPYGPPHPFSYMPPPPQPNPVMPISAVPPAPPNQASATGGVGQQHSLSAVNRFNHNAQQHHHSQLHHPAHHNQPQQSTHVGAGVDATGLGAMPGGLPQAPHQGPFYYYYPSPLYFDQSGGAAGAPPNHLYHPSSFHPQFFTVPGHAYLPNAHSFNQHQPQPPSASQSDATLLNQPQQPQQQTHQAPPTQQQSHQQTQQQQQTKDR